MTPSDPTPSDIEAEVRADLGGLASGAWFSPETVTELLRVIDSERHGRRTAIRSALPTPPPSLDVARLARAMRVVADGLAVQTLVDLDAGMIAAEYAALERSTP